MNGVVKIWLSEGISDSWMDEIPLVGIYLKLAIAPSAVLGITWNGCAQLVLEASLEWNLAIFISFYWNNFNERAVYLLSSRYWRCFGKFGHGWDH